MREHAGYTYEDQAAAGLFDSPDFDQEEIARAAAPASESTLRVVLRDYQERALDMTRQAIKEGARSILICAPTGGGKTVCGAALVEASQRKGSRSTFVVDRLSLINQTSETMFRYGLEHGVIQADHPMFRPSLQTQVCSVQTLARRKWPESQLDIIDEAHVLHQTVKRRIEAKAAITIGLTATPFTKGLGKYFERIINVTTTHNLIRDGWLVPYRILECQAPDMEGVKVTTAGEWDSAETEKRALQVVGDVVAEYIKHGEERKFICSAVDTAHVDELQRQFVAAGVNVASYTYKDSDEDRADVVSEFRRPESIIRGLITVTAASRGFDVADIGCVIMARPLRKSHAEHIQLFGRGLRISPATGKTDCLVLDHSGNCIAGGMRVLTDRGPVAIEQIKSTDKVWDGHEFVCHGGLVNRGTRPVIRYAGLTATADHRVKTVHGWRPFGSCAKEQAPIVTTGIGWAAIRECEGYFTGPAVAWTARTKIRACLVRVRRLWLSSCHLIDQLAGRKNKGLQNLQPAAQSPKVALCQGSTDAAPMHEINSNWIRELRRAWNQIRVRVSDARVFVDRGEPWTSSERSRFRVGQSGQRRALHAWKHSLGYEATEQQQSSCFSMGAVGSQVQTGEPERQVRRQNPSWFARLWSFIGADRCQMAYAVKEAERQVWDLLDCGPRNSFTCEGLLVHNCRRFWNDTQDFFENGWSELDDGKRKKATAQEKKPIEPVKCPQCRHMHKPAPSCPNCGHQYPRRQAIEHVPGTMKELIATGNRVAISRALWPQVIGYARERRGDGGEKLALALYKQMTGDWPTTKWANTPPAEVSMEVRRKITSLNIAWAKGRSKATA